MTGSDLPAVDHNGPRMRGVEGLHLLEEFEHPDGGEGHPEVRPAGEVQLRDQSWGSAAIGQLLRGHRDAACKQAGPSSSSHRSVLSGEFKPSLRHQRTTGCGAGGYVPGGETAFPQPATPRGCGPRSGTAPAWPHGRPVSSATASTQHGLPAPSRCVEVGRGQPQPSPRQDVAGLTLLVWCPCSRQWGTLHVCVL